VSFLSNVGRNATNNFTKSFMSSLNDALSATGGSIGSFGDIVFTASASKVETFNNYQRNTKARIASHDIIGKKPVLEFLGPSGEEISFNMKFNILLGVNPTVETDKLRKMCQEGKANMLILNNKAVGENYWVIDSVSEAATAFNQNAVVVSSSVDVTLKEYVNEI